MINAARLRIKWGMEFYGNSRRRSAGNFFAALGVFLATVVLFVGVFCLYRRDRVTVAFRGEYYFLVQDCEDTTASAVAGQVYFSGGAGYLVESGGESCVALACYFRKTDAERILGMMEERGIFCRILTLAAEEFALEGQNAAQKSRVEGNLETVETCAYILYDAANGLERADLTQEEARAAVKGVVSSLKGLREGNAGALYDLWNPRLFSAEKRGEEISGGILFAKDLRYLQTELCMAIVRADRCFSGRSL